MKTRAEMEEIIRSGRSVIVNNQIIDRVEALPSAAQLARRDPGAAEAEAQRLQAELDRVNAELAELTRAQREAAEQSGGNTGATGTQDDPRAVREKELKKLDRAGLDAVAGRMQLSTEGNMDAVRERILAAEFSDTNE